jgi:hypothetical protein
MGRDLLSWTLEHPARPDGFPLNHRAIMTEREFQKPHGRKRPGTPALAGALLLGTAIILHAGRAGAQSPPVPEHPPGAPPGTNPPSESTTPPPDAGNDQGKPDQPLSKDLKENEGVLEPPTALDNGIVRKPPVPDPGTTPVIPPPGSPGGNPDVEPK